MRIVTHILVAVIVACLVLFIVNRELSTLNQDFTLKSLSKGRESIEKRIEDISSRILYQIEGFSSTISNDRDFTMKLLVEQDFSASEVADIALGFIKSMGFDFLEIVDSNYKILSSGHFPASAGNSDIAKKTMPDSQAVCISQNIGERDILSLLVKIPFSCQGTRLYAIGGITIDTSFISLIKTEENADLILKYGKIVKGMENIETISEIKNNTIVINNKKWLATNIFIPWNGNGENPQFILLMKEPEKFSLMELL